MFNFLKSKLKKTGSIFAKAPFAIGSKIREIFSKHQNDALFDNLEQLFIEADLGVDFSLELVEKIRTLLKKTKDLTSDMVIHTIKEELLAILKAPKEQKPSPAKPHVIMIVGVNGSGKTTSIAKLAGMYQNEGKKVLIAAADTFRAAASEQLELWAKKLDVDIIRSQSKSDPASVAFDALQAAISRGSDVVLIDTAGRLHTKTDLMHELEKIRRVCHKVMENTPHETLLVLDATTGQNALDQAQIFHKFTPIDGIILTKLDGTAKGGIVISIQKKLNIPVRWVGVGEKEGDLSPFDPIEFIDALLEIK